MKILGIIPARYSSSRFPGKPLADTRQRHGKNVQYKAEKRRFFKNGQLLCLGANVK